MNAEWLLTVSKVDPIQHSNDTHELIKLGSLLPFFRGTIVIIPYLNDVPIFSFSWAYWFSFYTWVEQSIALHAVHHSEIFSGEEKVIR